MRKLQKNLVDSLYEGHLNERQKVLVNTITKHISGISFYDSIVVFEKKKRAAPFHIKKGEETIEPYIQKELQRSSLLRKLKLKLFGKIDTFRLNDKGKV
mgnify:CR=1 FL=1